jgi:DNA processing protein
MGERRRWEVVEDRDERAARWAVWTMRGIGYRRFESLLVGCDESMASLWSMSLARRRALMSEAKLPGRAIAGLEALCRTGSMAFAKEQLGHLESKLKLLHLGDRDYPGEFTDLDEPPVFVTVMGGDGLEERMRKVAIVGSRKATVADVHRAEAMAVELTVAGFVVVSGGALGIDAAAHRGSVVCERPGVVVLPGGLEAITPRAHLRLFEDIVACGGALISEYPPGARAERFHFRRRNHLIAALSSSVVIIRAERRSGTMLTAEAAVRLGRPLYVIPGAPDDPLAEGCLDLLMDGARPVRDGRDVLEALGRSGPMDSPRQPKRSDRRRRPPGQRRQRPVPPVGVSESALKVFEHLAELVVDAGEEVHVDELARSLQTTVETLGQGLLELELSGAVERVCGAHSYRLCH